jgi:hypothetical protein
MTDKLTNFDILRKADALGLQYPSWIVGVEPDEDSGLGLAKWWLFPRIHILTLAGDIHDLEYQVRYEENSCGADARFLFNGLVLSGNSLKFKITTRIFHSIAKTYGFFAWR